MGCPSQDLELRKRREGLELAKTKQFFSPDIRHILHKLLLHPDMCDPISRSQPFGPQHAPIPTLASKTSHFPPSADPQFLLLSSQECDCPSHWPMKKGFSCAPGSVVDSSGTISAVHQRPAHSSNSCPGAPEEGTLIGTKRAMVRLCIGAEPQSAFSHLAPPASRPPAGLNFQTAESKHLADSPGTSQHHRWPHRSSQYFFHFFWRPKPPRVALLATVNLVWCLRTWGSSLSRRRLGSKWSPRRFRRPSNSRRCPFDRVR